MELTRRRFIAIAAGTGIGLAIGLEAPAQAKIGILKPFEPNPFIRIAPDGSVTVLVKHLDMGQGVATGLATLVAEELDASHEQMRVEFAPADATKYAHTAFGAQLTGGSTSIANSYEQYRKAGAIARAMLVEAAAKTWGVPAAEITVSAGKIAHPSGRFGGFAQFAEAASALAVPEDVKLKVASAFVYIGKEFKRLDTYAKIHGEAIFTQDVQLDGMLTAVVAHPPKFGAKLKSFDGMDAKKVKGVVDVIAIPQGVAVLAKGTWPAIKGRSLLKIEWDESGAEQRGSADIVAEYKELAKLPGIAARNDGDALKALESAAQVVEAEFVFPYLAHAPMEPLNVVIKFDGANAELWCGSQIQTLDQGITAGALGIAADKVRINTLYAGGSFGRRGVIDGHYYLEAAAIAKTWGKPDPIKLVWTREDDIKGGYYRPIYVHRVKAGLDKDGNLVAWHHHIVGQSIFGGTVFESFVVKDGIDRTSIEGVSTIPYDIPNLRAELTSVKVGVPVMPWRSVGHTHTAYAVETMMDQLAAKAGKDPVEFRLALLGQRPRHARVLKLAAEKSGWNTPPAIGKFRGVAVHKSFRTYVAEIVEIGLDANGAAKVEKVVCAVDCGVAVNPDQVRAQMEGGIGFGLGAATKNQITLTAGAVDQANFDTYEPIRMPEMPVVEVYIVDSLEAPTGVGEPGVPPVAPALANAVFKATGRHQQVLPMSLGEAGKV